MYLTRFPDDSWRAKTWLSTGYQYHVIIIALVMAFQYWLITDSMLTSTKHEEWIITTIH